ncbi:receptor-like protein 7 [Cornus florida]|uniref:receptor-like protein 7 n=1 Tax=Cornus florida TaxID=4283 RepID=UPI00289DF70A|nr:receptor-like protein 7 [Cornus florida]
MACSPILCHFTFLHLLLLLTTLYCLLINALSSLQPLCRDYESSALMQFKHSISMDESASSDPSAYPKLASWNASSSDSCCSWDGVTCDEDTGRVIGLDLSSSFLRGSIQSNTTLFRLVHLQKLNLADNHFDDSQIPSDVGLLSMLTYLNLSTSSFAGQIPLEISNLTKLASLDLSFNFLELLEPGLTRLVQNLTDLKQLHLNDVNVSSTVPEILANFSSLMSLLVKNCDLHGEFPTGIFKLPNLQFLDVQYNEELSSYLPEFHMRRSPLKSLTLAGTSFYGELSNSIGNLHSLNTLDVSLCNFSGSIPTSIGNLAQLVYLDLSINNFSGSIPASIGSLAKLVYLDLSINKFSGENLSFLGKLTKLSFLSLGVNIFKCEIPSSFANLTQLDRLYMNSNQLTGQIPSGLMNLTRLTILDLSDNLLQGPIPESISQLANLQELYIDSNNLSGRVKLDAFFVMKNLTTLHLSYNHLTLLTNRDYTNAPVPKFHHLGLETCNLTEFPDFLRLQDELLWLHLSNNKIQGPLPTWIWNMSIQTLFELDLSQNFITGFYHHPLVLPWGGLAVLDLSSNMLRGSFPVPPPSTLVYKVANNMFTGEIPPLLCNVSSLLILDLSYNNMSGIIPQCLGSETESLKFLNLRNNKLCGPIPQGYKNGTQLTKINLSQNQLEGPVPRSLANCTILESLDLGNNHINDVFPFWLGTLYELKVLILRFNRFHGAIRNPKSSLAFPKLHILDISHNGFTGKLPSGYFHTWTSMKTIDVNQSTSYGSVDFARDHNNYMTTLSNKGVQIGYLYVLNVFAAIDLSSNRFEGKIPESIGILKCLHSLNLSNNNLIGQIPSSLGNLTEVESLDLSRNKLSGEIPQQLTQLTFLAFFNVSHNHLSGPIPRGRQFDTFENSSYEMNSGLCGDPLAKKCGNLEASPPPSNLKQDDDDDSWFPIDKTDWIVICMGYGGGLTVGLIIGHTLTTRYHEWFVSTFGRNQKKQRKKNKSRRRN